MASRLLRVLAPVLVLVAAIAMPTSACAQKGTSAFGAEIGYVTKNKSAMFGITYQYAFSDHFRMAPQVGYIFRHHDKDAFYIDLDAQVPFTFSSENVSLYPIAGLNYSSWNRHMVDDENGDVSTRRSRFGFNAGAGIDIKVSPSMKIFFEAKYNIIKQFSALRVSVGAAYLF